MLIFALFFFRQIPAKEKDTKNLESLVHFYQTEGISLDSMQHFFLYQNSFDWVGTKYNNHRNGMSGIDCSGFTIAVYKSTYGIELSGGSRDIIKEVDSLFKDKSKLKEGDLVFFKTKKGRVSHVGVYLMDGKFVHSTTHSGVIVSSLDEPYYKKTYYRSGRINEIQKSN